jgi:hypothetical protein
MVTSQVSLTVNDTAIDLDDFVQRFIDHVIGGILATLKDTGEINSVDILIVADKVTINLNNKVVPTNPFVSEVTRNVITGMVSSLKGVRETNRINISIKR